MNRRNRMKRFSPQMAAAVPADKLQAVWESLPKQAGPLHYHQPGHVDAQPITDVAAWIRTH